MMISNDRMVAKEQEQLSRHSLVAHLLPAHALGGPLPSEFWNKVGVVETVIIGTRR